MVGYKTVVLGLAGIQCQYGYSIGSKETVSRYVLQFGFVKRKQPKKANGKKYTGKEFCEALNRNYAENRGKRFVCDIGGHHMVCIKEHIDEGFKVWDIWDSTDGCIGNYWAVDEAVI